MAETTKPNSASAAASLDALDPIHDILRYQSHPLDSIFKPNNVAVIGATEKEGSVGRTLLWNLITSPFGGTVFPVNPKRSNVLGIKAYKSIAEVPETVDLAVIVTPAPSVPGLIQQCSDAGVKGVIVISAGFKEMGPEGLEYERQIMEIARKSRMRIVGPNCLGVMMPLSGLNATFAKGTAKGGTVGFISQSGALCTAVLDWSNSQNVGFSAFISIGSMVDVDWGDLIDYLGNDPNTKSIVIYMESIGNARSFLSAAREVAQTKPIIVIKAGRTAAAAKAAASHTGSLCGSDDVLEAAFRRSGVLRVSSIDELFYMAEVLAKQPRPNGPNLTILTNAGGPGVLATDALITSGGELTDLSEKTMEELNGLLPVHWSHNNPIDVLGDAAPERYAQSLEIASRDDNSDGLLVVLTPQDMTDPTLTAEHLKPYAKIEGKPVLASWMGGSDVAAGEAILNRAGIPTFPYPDMAARVFSYMWRYSYNLRGLYETPEVHSFDEEDVCNREWASGIIETARREGRTLLTETESKQVMEAYGIPTVPTRVADSSEKAAELADQMGFPVVVKLDSRTITHKTDVGGVKLNITSKEGVVKAFEEIKQSVTEKAGAEHFDGVSVQKMVKISDGYEIILGSSLDPQFGPVLLFGAGGQLVEVMQDRSLALPPLNTTLARRMMEQTKIFKALQGVRGRDSVDMGKMEQLMVNFSNLVCEQHWIKEIDINPLIASSEQILALDARVVLHPVDTQEKDLPTVAIRPYPIQYSEKWQLKDGSPVTITPIRPEDEPLVVEFNRHLSDKTVLSRFFQPLTLTARVRHERLTRICYIDYDREMALVVKQRDEKTGEKKILGIGRLHMNRDFDEADFAMTIRDDYQNLGLGTKILESLVDVARKEGYGKVKAVMLTDSKDMLRVCTKMGFEIEGTDNDGKHTRVCLNLNK